MKLSIKADEFTMFDINSKRAEEVSKSFFIPSKPEILEDLQREMATEEPRIGLVAELVSKDVGLAANVLKAINSPAFGLQRTVTDIAQSVMMLGINNIANLVRFYELRKALSGKACISLERFWDAAVETAELMVITLNLLNLKKNCPPEDAYALGLFHDCGIPLMAMRHICYKDTLTDSDKPDHSLPELEEKRYSVNHAVLGYFIAKSWNLPDRLCHLIQRHHDPYLLDSSKTRDKDKDLVALLKISENCQNRFKRHSPHNDWNHFADKVYFHFGLNDVLYSELESDATEELSTHC